MSCDHWKMPQRFTTLITDFDNTLYDWFHMWNQSFQAMLEEVRRKVEISDDVLLPQIRAIHQRHRTAEYAFLLEELPCLQQAFPRQNIVEVFDDAIHAYRSARKNSLELYAGVRKGIQGLRSRGISIVVYTESLAFYTNFRIRRLELDELVDFIYSPPDHELPDGVDSHVESDEAQLLHAEHRYLPAGVKKPNPEVLLDIVREIDRTPSECIYLGDSLMKDVAMAQGAEIVDVYAEYGGAQHHKDYELLRKVSHWTDGDVDREKAMSKKLVTPTYSISKFDEINRFFEG